MSPRFGLSPELLPDIQRTDTDKIVQRQFVLTLLDQPARGDDQQPGDVSAVIKPLVVVDGAHKLRRRENRAAQHGVAGGLEPGAASL